jgi:hypothetical protein
MATLPFVAMISLRFGNMRSFLHPNALMLAILIIAIIVALSS